MPSKIAIVFHYIHQNKNSYHALAGALEKEKLNIPLYFFEKDFVKNLEKIVPNFEKIVVAISFCTPQILEIATLVKKIRKKFGKEILLLAGGPHTTGDPRGTLKNLGFDLTVIGEGEKTFTDLISKLEKGEEYKKIKGIAYLSHNNYCYTGHREPINLDDYPPFAEKYKKFNPIEITRGCSFGCKFCQTTFMYNAPVRHRSIDKICKYVETGLKYDIKEFRFVTPNAFSYGSENGCNINLNKLENLLKSVRGTIKNKGKMFLGSFPSEVRPEHVTPDTIELVKTYTDNDNLIFGAQSGSPKILEQLNRGHTVEDVYNAAKLTIESGLKANIDFIFGLPNETKEDIAKTLKFMDDLTKLGARIHGHTFMPLAGTPYSNEPPRKLDKRTLKTLNTFLSEKYLYGNWVKQEEMAQKIYNFMQQQK